MSFAIPLLSSKMNTPSSFFSKTRLFAFLFLAGTSASSSVSNSFTPNCLAAQSLNNSKVPSLQSLQLSVNEFPTIGEFSTLKIKSVTCHFVQYVNLLQSMDIVSIFICYQAHNKCSTLKLPVLNLLSNITSKFLFRIPKHNFKYLKTV